MFHPRHLFILFLLGWLFALFFEKTVTFDTVVFISIWVIMWRLHGVTYRTNHSNMCQTIWTSFLDTWERYIFTIVHIHCTTLRHIWNGHICDFHYMEPLFGALSIINYTTLRHTWNGHNCDLPLCLQVIHSINWAFITFTPWWTPHLSRNSHTFYFCFRIVANNSDNCFPSSLCEKAHNSI